MLLQQYVLILLRAERVRSTKADVAGTVRVSLQSFEIWGMVLSMEQIEDLVWKHVLIFFGMVKSSLCSLTLSK